MDYSIQDHIMSEKIVIQFSTLDELNQIRRVFHMEPFTISYWDRGGYMRIARFSDTALYVWIYPICFPIPNQWPVISTQDLVALTDESKSILELIK